MVRSQLTAISASWVQAFLLPQPPGPHHHAWLIFVFLVETGLHHVGQAGLELLTSGLPSSASQNARITGVSQCAPPLIDLVEFLSIIFTLI